MLKGYVPKCNLLRVCDDLGKSAHQGNMVNSYLLHVESCLAHHVGLKSVSVTCAVTVA